MQDQSLSSVSLRQAIVFFAVVEQGGFALAGQALFMTQPAVSKSVARLEGQLGLALFERSTRKLKLTAAGEQLYQAWRPAVGAMQAAYRQALQVAHPGTLNIGIISTIDNRPVTAVTDAFSKHFPEVELNLENDEIEQLSVRLYSGHYDVVFVPDFDHYSYGTMGFDWKWAARKELQVLVPAGHRLAAKKRLGVEDILDENFVFLDEAKTPNYRRYLEDLFAQYGRVPAFSKGYKSPHTIKNAYYPRNELAVTDDYFAFPWREDVRKIPVDGVFNGIICAWDSRNKNIWMDRFVRMVGEDID